MARVAVVLFNLGGPDSPEAVAPFLKNLFADPAILGLPQPFRWLLGRLIVWRRAKKARAIYAKIGGSSPLLGQTRDQAQALEVALNAALDDQSDDYRAFVCMRYWHPMSDVVAAEVARWGADRVILLPLYPQFSTTTTGSSVADWRRAAHQAGLSAPTKVINDYPELDGFSQAMADLTVDAVEATPVNGPLRVLFSAHGLPQKVVDGGDPYPEQVQRSAVAIVDKIGDALGPLDWRVSYQSRVGPARWIAPYTDDEIRRAGADRVAVVVVPVAFVSEHSETLVELDMDYKELAQTAGVSTYIRVPTVGTNAKFINGLAGLVRQQD